MHALIASKFAADLGDDAAELLTMDVRRRVVAAAEVDSVAGTDQVHVVTERPHRLAPVNVHRYLHTRSCDSSVGGLALSLW